MAIVEPIGFSENNEYFAYSSTDGVLKIWDTDTGRLKQEYTPSSHLSATCTCLCWAPTSCVYESPKKKRKKKKIQSEAESNVTDLISLGTTSGCILLYSVIKGDLHSQLDGGHTDVVHGICWERNNPGLYSCSQDGHVIHWCLQTGNIQTKWKADEHGVNSCCLCMGEQAMLTASRNIKLWNIKTKEVLKTFTGHATPVFQLIPLSLGTMPEMDEEDMLQSGSYFLSAAIGDRLINAWQINSSKKSKNAMAAFSLPEEPVLVHVSIPLSKEQPILLAVVTKSGQLIIFEHVLNGTLKKPLKAKLTVQVSTGRTDDGPPKPIKILGARTCNDSSKDILVSHGSFLRPSFERVSHDTTERDMCLVREDTTQTSLKADDSVSKIKTPNTSQEVTVLGPGHMTPSAPAQGSISASKKKRKTSINDISISERIQSIGLNTDAPLTHQPPKADTLATLLGQGLQSHDNKILNNVLQNTNETIICNTVKKLPVPLIIPLVQELSKRMQGHAQSGKTLIRWLKAVLTVHASYLTTLPGLEETLSPLYQMMASRVQLLAGLLKLKGKLDLILSQMTSSMGQDDEDDATNQAMLIYDEDSSDDEMLEEDILQGHSESEDNWEESDMEVKEESDKESSDSD